MLKDLITKIVNTQKSRKAIFAAQAHYPVDIVLTNGNILLRAFRIYDLKGEKLKGMTWKEEYSAPREKRNEVFCYIDLDDIASLKCSELGIEYEKETSIW